MSRKQKNLVRLVAIVLAVLLTFSVVISAVLSFAYGEEATEYAGNQCELTMEYLEQEQALRISQRLVYANETDFHLDRMVFYAPANLFRRQASLPYDADEISTALPAGYLPGGMDLSAVRVNGEACDWGFQGTDEMYLRVSCDLAPGASCSFEFDYYLLLTENAAFLGLSENDCRLSDFYFAPASLDASGEFILNMPLSFTRYTDVPAMDFSATIALPKSCALAATGVENATTGGGIAAWSIRAQNARDFALAFALKRRETTAETASGVQIRALAASSRQGRTALEAAREAIEICESWFGEFPFRQIDIIQADYGPGSLNHSGCLWLNESILKEGGRALRQAVYGFVAQQYFGRSAWAYPVSDAWLSDSISEFLGYLILEELDGHDAYIRALNEDLVDSLQLTIPGGLSVNSDASLFTSYEYDIIVRNRGAIVFHELYTAMGREDLIEGLRIFHQKGMTTVALSEMDLARSLEEASGKSWEKFLTDWVFNVGDYVNQDIYWLE